MEGDTQECLQGIAVPCRRTSSHLSAGKSTTRLRRLHVLGPAHARFCSCSSSASGARADMIEACLALSCIVFLLRVCLSRPGLTPLATTATTTECPLHSRRHHPFPPPPPPTRVGSDEVTGVMLCSCVFAASPLLVCPSSLVLVTPPFFPSALSSLSASRGSHRDLGHAC